VSVHKKKGDYSDKMNLNDEMLDVLAQDGADEARRVCDLVLAEDRKQPKDSTGIPIFVGDVVRFKNRYYRIKGFRQGEGRSSSWAIDFIEPLHTDEVADEYSVDLLLAEKHRERRKEEWNRKLSMACFKK